MRLKYDPVCHLAEEFHRRLYELAQRMHEASVIRLQEISSDLVKDFAQQAETAPDEADWQLALDCGKAEEETARERERSVGWLFLIYLVILHRSTLKALTHPFEDTHPREGNYEGKSDLGRLCDEYRKRFSIDLGNGPKFSVIEQLVLARNCVEHNDGKPTRDYLDRFPERPFVAADGTIAFSNQDFAATLNILDVYIDWLTRELMLVRDGFRPDGPLVGIKFLKG